MKFFLLVPVFVLAACGPDQDTLAQVEQLQVRVSDLEAANARLEKEVDSYRQRNGDLEQEMARYRNREIYSRLGIDQGQNIQAVLTTSMGSIRCDLWPDVAPNTVLNFVALAEGTKEWEDPRTGRKVERPLYSNTIFHRVIPGFMIQAGDPLGNGTGGPGYRFADEILNGVTFDKEGLLAMANAGPDTNGSQFFITVSKPSHLNGKHTIFGYCPDNLDVVRAISQVPRDERDKPRKDVVLEKVLIVR